MTSTRFANRLIGFLVLCGIVVLLLFVPRACTDRDGAKRVLRQAGYTDVTVGGYRWWGAGGGWYVTTFSATSPSGERVSGVVTSALVGSKTIRLD